MKEGLKWTVAGVSAFLTACALVAVAESYEWETKINGIEVELKGTAPQVSSKKLQNDCLVMASYAIQQFRLNGGTLNPKMHEVECTVGSDGRVSALLTGNTKETFDGPKQTYQVPKTPEPLGSTSSAP